MEGHSWLFKNLANFVTALRLLMVFWLAWLLFWQPWQIVFILLAQVVCAATDLVDGILARKLEIVSEFGGLFDAATDKFWLFVTFIGLVWHFWPPESLPELLAFITQYLALLFLFLELILVATTVIGFFSGQRNFASVTAGRWKMDYAVAAAIIWFLAVTIKQFWNIDFYLVAALLIDFCLIMALYYWKKSASFYWPRFQNFL